jgi:estrogen-related receptor beta like 1
VYPEEEYPDDVDADDDADAGSDVEDIITGDGDGEEVMYTEMKHVETSEEDRADKEVIVATVDPILWNTELERVGPRLKVKPTGGKEWRGHIEQTKTHEQVYWSPAQVHVVR